MRCTVQTGPDGLDQTLTIECDSPPFRRTYRLDDKLRQVWAIIAKNYGAPSDPAEAVVGGWRDLLKKASSVTRRAVRSSALRDIASVAKRVAPIASSVIPGGAVGMKAFNLLSAAKRGSTKARRKIAKIEAMADADPRAAKALGLLKQVNRRMVAASQVVQGERDEIIGGQFRTPSRWLLDQSVRPGAGISARALYSRGLGQIDNPVTSAIDFARDRFH